MRLLLLTLSLTELYEVVHILCGRVAYGGFGPRGFNSWSLAEGSEAIWPTLMGLAFPFAIT